MQLRPLCIIYIICFSKNVRRNEALEASRGVNGGIPCATCTVLVGIAEQFAQVHNSTIENSLQEICSFMPTKLAGACTTLVSLFGKPIATCIYHEITPDVVCHYLKFCRTDPGQPECHLFPEPDVGISKQLKKTEEITKKHFRQFVAMMPDNICDIPGIDLICDLFAKSFKYYEPLEDWDNDGFSALDVPRGSSWRGRDCDDINTSIRPGRRPVLSDKWNDYNCNGIYGVDDVSGESLEDMLCGKSSPRGVAYLGDSVGGHFHFPQEWFMAEKLSKEYLSYVPYVIEHEFDWPMTSAVTGFVNITWPILSGPTISLYSLLRERNLCNHRNYQNFAVNGADSFDIQSYQTRFKPNQTTDYPMFVIIALFGNDVCNHYPDTVEHMTTVEAMMNNTMSTLIYLNTSLPADSHVLLVGLADGRILYESMSNRYHPLGALNKDVNYINLYDYMNCLQVTPCRGWLNTNETLRNVTNQRAIELSEVLKKIASTYRNHFENFDVNYVDCPLTEVMEDWERKYGPGSAYHLIETADGFHPNQYAEALAAQYVWSYLEAHLPDYIGPINANNAKINEIFGSQGGH